MTLAEIITNSLSYNDELTLFAKKIDGHLKPSSEAVLIELSEEEEDTLDVSELEALKCPGFSYCMPLNMIQDMVKAYGQLDDEKIDRIIYYIEYDA